MFSTHQQLPSFLNSQIVECQSRISVLEERTEQHEDQLASFELMLLNPVQRLQTDLIGFIRSLDSKVSELSTRFAEMERKVNEIDQRTGEMTTKVSRVDRKRSTLKKKVGQVNEITTVIWQP
jgi:uncharacterized protein (DUF3084 family)